MYFPSGEIFVAVMFLYCITFSGVHVFWAKENEVIRSSRTGGIRFFIRIGKRSLINERYLIGRRKKRMMIG